jgi:hypothetical protein
VALPAFRVSGSARPFRLVQIEVAPNRLRNVHSVAAAAAMLLGARWPTARRGPAYAEGLRVCRDALEGKRTAEAARRAFIAAAQEAGILVRAAQ